MSANDPDCGVNAMVNYTMGAMGLKTFTEFDVRSATGEICIARDLDYEKKQAYEFPIIATDRGKFQVQIYFSFPFKFSWNLFQLPLQI